ncbi:hypothetical protein ACVIJ6_006071 [Bradyrhizobium sp. USDA 4369]
MSALYVREPAPGRGPKRSLTRPNSAVADLQGRSDGTNDSRDVFLAFRDADAAFSQTFSSARFEPAVVAKSNNLVPMPGMVDGRTLPGSRSLCRTQRARLGPDRPDTMLQRRHDLRSGAMDRLTMSSLVTNYTSPPQRVPRRRCRLILCRHPRARGDPNHRAACGGTPVAPISSHHICCGVWVPGRRLHCASRRSGLPGTTAMGAAEASGWPPHPLHARQNGRRHSRRAWSRVRP